MRTVRAVNSLFASVRVAGRSRGFPGERRAKQVSRQIAVRGRGQGFESAVDTEPSSLAELLEARKSITNSAELETLAKRHHVDVAKLEQIARVVNTPRTDTVVRITDQHGEVSLTMTARWIDSLFLYKQRSLRN